MKILMISPYFSPAVGGVETHLSDLCKYFESKKHTIFVRTYQAFGVKDRGEIVENNKYIKIHRLPWPDFNLIFKLERYPFIKFIYLFIGLFIDSFLFTLKNYKDIDVIQAHGFIAALIAVLLGKIFDKRVVVNTHVGFNLREGIMTEIIKWTLINSNKVLVLTNGIKKSLVNIGIPEKKIDIYHYWVDQKIFDKQKGAQEDLKWSNKFVVLFVGRLIEVKGVLKILSLAKKLTNITFAIVGSGPLSQELKEKSIKYKNIQFVGKIDNSRLPVFYSAADLLIIPSEITSQEYEEGIPRVMIEGLSCSLPIISTKSGGIPDIFSEKIGRLVEDDLDSMVSAIQAYENKKLIMEASKNCREYALKYFSIKNAQIIEDSLAK